ncbi:MAG TPA: hypothetical protein VF023_12070 [Bryobacteraceae bacterium]|jgi:transposase-like protein
MKKPVLALFISACMGIGSTALLAQPQDQQSDQQQNDQHPHRRGRRGARNADPQQMVNRLSKRLNLTSDQQQKLLPIFTDQQQQMKSLWQDNSLSRDDRMTKMKSIHEDTNNKVNAILNEEQKQKYADMQQKMRERMQNRMQSHGSQNQ